MTVIKNAKRDTEQKVKEMAKNKVKGSLKTRAKRGKKGKKARAHYGCPKREKGMVKKVLTGQQ